MVARGTRGRPSAATRAAGLGFGAVALLALLSGCDVGKAFAGFGWPQEGITEDAHRMYDLWIGSTVAALIVGVLVWGLIFWCVVRYRKRGEELPAQTRYNIPMETVYTVAPFLIIAVLFYYTAIVQTDIDEIEPNPDVVVEVVGFQWNWQFNYLADEAPDSEVVASTLGSSDYIPVLVVPNERRIRFIEHSPDVIHSFWVPEMLFKRDVFPGEVRNVFEVVMDREGAYVGRCAELCGAYHFAMNFELRVVSPDEFDRFLAAKRDGASTPEALTRIGEEPYATTTSPFETQREQLDLTQGAGAGK